MICKKLVLIQERIKVLKVIQDTVPVEAAYQVWRVTRVLSMGKVNTHVQGVPEKSCKIKPWEIFEKMQF